MGELKTNSGKVLPNNNIKTYDLDGRLPIETLWARYDKLVDSGLFVKELIYNQIGYTLNGREIEIPAYGYKSIIHEGENRSALWVLSGIHGEEPAGPNAIADNVDEIIKQVQQGIPMVVVPLLNGLGYIRDDRYFDSHRGKGSSVSDSDHLLGITEEPNSLYADQLGKWVIQTSKSHQPYLLFDHHEDEIEHDLSVIDAHKSYNYSYGIDKEKIEALSIMLIKILADSGFPIQESGKTRFGEVIDHGFVRNSNDGSVDDLLSRLLGLKAGFVIETTRDDTVPIKLTTRIMAHTNIIKLYKTLWDELNRSVTC